MAKENTLIYRAQTGDERAFACFEPHLRQTDAGRIPANVLLVILPTISMP